jgi:hypothetical protein
MPKLGRPLGNLEGKTASVARAHSFAVATLVVGDFEECGVELIFYRVWSARCHHKNVAPSPPTKASVIAT